MNVFPMIAGTLCARMSRGFNGQDATGGLLVVTTSPNRQSANIYNGGGASPLMERNCKSPDNIVMEPTKRRKYIVRRLTPTECLRLQGLPDWWCEGANGSDSSMYRMAGNAIAIPCAEDVLARIVKAINKGVEIDHHKEE